MHWLKKSVFQPLWHALDRRTLVHPEYSQTPQPGHSFELEHSHRSKKFHWDLLQSDSVSWDTETWMRRMKERRSKMEFISVTILRGVNHFNHRHITTSSFLNQHFWSRKQHLIHCFIQRHSSQVLIRLHHHFPWLKISFHYKSLIFLFIHGMWAETFVKTVVLVGLEHSPLP